MKHLPLIILSLFVISCGQTTQNNESNRTPEPVGTPLIGESSMTDKSGDLKQEDKGKLQKESNCIDIREAKLETTERGLKLFITVNGKAPATMPKYEAAIWQATICTQDGEHCLDLGAMVEGSKTTAYVMPMSPPMRTQLDQPIFTSDTVLVIAPKEKLPAWAMTAPLQWRLTSEWSPDGEWHDYLPDRTTKGDFIYVKHPA